MSVHKLELKPKVDVNKNTIVCGDNIEWLNWIPDGSIDLCYIDPPFYSQRTYETIWGNGCEKISFDDRTKGGVKHFIAWMRPRLEIIHRKLKATGSIVLHCDSNAGYRLRVELDEIFGENNFVNEIYWQRNSSHNDAKYGFGDIVDTLLFYQKDKSRGRFFPVVKAHDPAYLLKSYNKDDNDGRGRYRLDNITSPNPRENLTYPWKGFKPPAKGWRYKLETMEKLDREGRIYYPVLPNGKFDYSRRPAVKRYLSDTEEQGQKLSNLWDDIAPLQSMSKERIGYPTQKPEALVRRVLEFASSEGDLVLDCFAGGGTTAKACIDMNRRFIVGDVSPVAVRMMADRLKYTCGIFAQNIPVLNLSKTREEFRSMDGFEFEHLICSVTGWTLSKRTGGSGDGGIDAWDANNNPVQIKNEGNKTGRPELQKFCTAIQQARKKSGIFLAWDFASTAHDAVADFESKFGVKVELWKCDELLKSLILPEQKHAEIVELYDARKKVEWTEHVKAVSKVGSTARNAS